MNAMAVNKVVYGTTVLVDLTGDTVTADKLLKGATAHDAAGEPITGTMEPGIDTSDATATPDDMAEGVTAYVKGEKVTGNLLVLTGVKWVPGLTTAGWNDSDSSLWLSGELPEKRIFKSKSKFNMYCSGEKLGDATAADVAEGKTFTSTAGLKVTGTAKASAPTLQSKTVSPSTSQQIITPDSGYDGLSSVTVEGDANLVPGNIKSGVSIFGVVGSFEGSGGSGGSSDNNCEAYHITSASAKLNFKGTGTVKVWGYGTATSGYQTHMYAFVGDGYYKSASWGSPTKTSASFSVNADGTLSGLPNMSACDLLVTIGV